VAPHDGDGGEEGDGSDDEADEADEADEGGGASAPASLADQNAVPPPTKSSRLESTSSTVRVCRSWWGEKHPPEV